MRNLVLFSATQLFNRDEAQVDEKMAAVLVCPFSTSMAHPTQEKFKEHMNS